MDDIAEVESRVATLEKSVNEHHAAQSVRDVWLEREISDIKRLLQNGIVTRVTSLEFKVDALATAIQNQKDSLSQKEKDLKSLLMPLVSHAIEWGIVALMVLAIIHFAGLNIP